MNDRRHLAVVRGGDEEGGSGIQGLEHAQETVVEFLTETVGKVRTDKLIGQLFQQGFQAGKTLVHFPFGAEDDFQEVAQDVVAAAEKDLSQCGDDQKILYSFRLEGHDGRCNFPLTSASYAMTRSGGNSDLSEHEGDIMIPRASHLIAQQMQHNQVFAQLLVSGSTDQIKGYQEEMREMRKRIQFLETERTKYLDSREEILSLQHKRDMEIRSQEKSEHRKDQFTSLVMNAGAPIVNKFLKQKIMPEKVTPLEGQLIALASTLNPTHDPNQLDKIMACLDLPQKNNFMQILLTIKEFFEEEARKTAEPATPAGPASPFG